MSWLDEEYVDDIIYKNWNIDIKKDYIPDLEEIIKRREQKKNKKINFNKKQLEILNKAVKEYEENHYDMEDDKWQEEINTLYFKIVEEKEEE